MSGQFNSRENNVSYWTLTPFPNDVHVNFVQNEGLGLHYGYWMSVAIKPSFNLKPNVIITSGDGTKNNPFILSVE